MEAVETPFVVKLFNVITGLILAVVSVLGSIQCSKVVSVEVDSAIVYMVDTVLIFIFNLPFA